MKTTIFKIYLCLISILILNQCTTISSIPPNEGNTGVPSTSQFEKVTYHIGSQLGAAYLVDNNQKLEVQKVGSTKPEGMNWTIERVKNLKNEEFYRIKSGNGNYLHIENGKLEATPLGDSGWHSAMWAFVKKDKNNSAYRIWNRWKSDQHIQMDFSRSWVGAINERSLAHGLFIIKASEVAVKEEPPIVEPPVVDPPVKNPLLVLLNGENPFTNGHPNLQPDLPLESTPNFNGNGGGGEAFIGQIKMFAGNFAPRGWAKCDGQLLAIAENSALFSLIGTFYGGDGITTFGLPDLRGRAPLHSGSKKEGEIRINYMEGKRFGPANVNLFKDEYQNKENLKKLIEVNDGVNIPKKGVKSQPTLGVHYVIALGGTFPVRN